MRAAWVSRMLIRIDRISMPSEIRVALFPVGGRILLLGVGEDRHVAVRPHQGHERLQIAGVGRGQYAIARAQHRRRQSRKIGGDFRTGRARHRGLAGRGRPLDGEGVGAAVAARGDELVGARRHGRGRRLDRLGADLELRQGAVAAGERDEHNRDARDEVRRGGPGCECVQRHGLTSGLDVRAWRPNQQDRKRITRAARPGSVVPGERPLTRSLQYSSLK